MKYMKARNFFIVMLVCLLFPLMSSALHADEVPYAGIASRGLQSVDFPRAKILAPGVYAYEGLISPLPDGTIFTTVSLIVITQDGVVVVDGQGDVWQTKLMIEFIKDITAQPIKYVVIGSDHGDHVGGNAAFKSVYPDVTFVSSPVSQLNLANTAIPVDQTVVDEHTIKMGETAIQILNLGRAHTGGDLAVYLPESKVLFLGEIYMRGIFPSMRTAYPSEWLGVIEKAQAMDVTWYIPGHGFIDDAASMERDLEGFRQTIAAVINESRRLHAAGEMCESASACSAATKANWGQYEELTASGMQAPFAIRRVYQEIEGVLNGVRAEFVDRGLVELWASNQAAFGEYVTLPYTVRTGRELAANPLLDYAFISLEASYDISWVRDVLEGLRGAGSSLDLLVRIPPISQDGEAAARARVNELLSIGVNGVVIPDVKSAEEARIAVSFFQGFNVWSPNSPDGDIVAMLMLEDPSVFAELEEIANIPGYSALACGIGTLTSAMGGDREAAERLNLDVLAHSQRVGMVDMITASKESVELRVNQGFLGLLVSGPAVNEVIGLGRAAVGR